jgi:hypothetical protein
VTGRIERFNEFCVHKNSPDGLWERIRRMKPARFEPMNRMTCEIFSLAPIGGEGRGEGAIRSASRFMGRVAGGRVRGDRDEREPSAGLAKATFPLTPALWEGEICSAAVQSFALDWLYLYLIRRSPKGG